MLSKAFWLIILAFQALSAFGGGSGLNIVVVVNQNSTNSLQLGNDYCEKRSVPPQNLFRMTNWTGGAIAWSRSDFEAYLRDPLFTYLAATGLRNQVSYILLSMDIPYRVELGDSGNSTTSELFYGFKANTIPPPDTPASCSVPDASSNSFCFSEMPFELAKPNTAPTNSYLAFMLTDDTLAGAESILSRAVAADGTFPSGVAYLEKTSDPARNVRFFRFDNAVFDSRVRGDMTVQRIQTDNTSFTNLLGLLSGLATLSLGPDTFVPGAVGDSLTSYAGGLFDNTGQTTLLAFLGAGAAASYGTVIEPCNWLQKFPDPMVFVYQNRGFNVAEAYYQSVQNPFEGLFVGEPLSAPFASPGQADWPGLTNSTVLSGQVSLPAASFSAAAADRPLAQVDLFVDGLWAETLTNIVPIAASVLSVTVNGSLIQYAVPANATLFSVASGLSDAINLHSNSTQVAATPFGDRIELQSFDPATSGTKVLLSASSSPESAVVLSSPRTNLLDSIAVGYVVLTVTNPTVTGDWLNLQVTKTNGVQVSLSVTNSGITNTWEFCQSLLNAVNASPDLQGDDGIVGGELYPDQNSGQFLLYAHSAGWPAGKVRATLTSSTNLQVLPSGEHTFEDNSSDLMPRNHLYVSSGLPQISVPVTLDTTRLADGFHELTLIAYEGTSVRTQTRVTRSIQVHNGSLTATITPQVVGTNVAVDMPLTLLVQAAAINVSKIELFSTGGLIGTISNQQNAAFSVPANLLGVGSHSFYAIVTDSVDQQFRTQTVALRVIPSIALTISGAPLTLSWAAVPGLSYDVIASTNLANGFQKVATVAASGPIAQWVISSSDSQGFYRIRLNP